MDIFDIIEKIKNDMPLHSGKSYKIDDIFKLITENDFTSGIAFEEVNKKFAGKEQDALALIAAVSIAVKYHILSSILESLTADVREIKAPPPDPLVGFMVAYREPVGRGS